MTPPASLEISATTSADWPHSDHYHALVASVEKLVAATSANGVYRHLPGAFSDTLPRPLWVWEEASPMYPQLAPLLVSEKMRRDLTGR